MYWQTNVARLAVLGRLPFGHFLRQLKRQIFGYTPDWDNLRGTIHDLDAMEGELNALGRTFRHAAILEIGSGWFPVVPIALCARGARQVIMTDLKSHLDEFTFATAVEFLRASGSEYHALPSSATLSDFPLHYLAPVRWDEVPDCSIDYVISRTVLEHIPPLEMRALFHTLSGKLSPQGLMIHCVDHSDHLEHRDKRLSKVNFLTWSNRKHRLINWLTKEGENRLRHSDYPSLLEEAGYEVLVQKGEIHRDTELRLAGMKLAHEYQGREPSDLATLKSIFVAAKAARPLASSSTETPKD